MAYWYAVGIGKRPGVYRTWLECQRAIGNRDLLPRREWRKFETREEAEAFVLLYNVKLDDGTYVPIHLLQQQNHGLADQNAQLQQQLELATLHNTQRIDRLYREMEILKKEPNQFGSLDEALATISHQMNDGGPSADAGAAFLFHYRLFYDGLFCVVYPHGAYFSCGPKGDNSRAGVGVWFGAESTLNIGMGYMDNVRRSKNDAEILAMLIALQAAKEKRISCIEVRSRSEFLRNRFERRDATGASAFLLTKLIKLLQSFVEVRLVNCPASDRGAKEAKAFAESNC